MYLHLTQSVLISLQLTARAKAADAGIQKQFSDKHFRLLCDIISNKETNVFCRL